MAIVFDSDAGTITGISVGGLPDGVVDAGTLATNSVDSAELIDGAVDDAHMTTLAASKLTGALPAISGASLTGIPGNTPSWRVRVGSTQSVAHSTWTKLVCDTEDWDTDSAFDSSTNYRFTVPSGKAGKYHCRANAYLSGLDDAESFHLQIFKNGSGVQMYNTVYSPAGGQEGWISMSNEVDLAVGDYLEVFCYHTDTNNNNLGANHCSFGGYRITT